MLMLDIHESQCDGILLSEEDRGNLLLEAVCTAFLPTIKYVHLSRSTTNVRYGQPVTVALVQYLNKLLVKVYVHGEGIRQCNILQPGTAVLIFQHLLGHIDETIIQPFVMVFEDIPVSGSQALE